MSQRGSLDAKNAADIMRLLADLNRYLPATRRFVRLGCKETASCTSDWDHQQICRSASDRHIGRP
jgi:hypothetical protein